MCFTNIHIRIKKYIEDPTKRFSTFKLFKELNEDGCGDIIKQNYPSLNDVNDIKQLAYHTYHKLFDIPKCPVCGSDNKFKSFSEGYSQYCRRSCQLRSVNSIRNEKKKLHTLYFKTDENGLREFLKTKYPRPGLTKPLKNSFNGTDWYDMIKISGVTNLNQLIYMFINNINKVPICKVCNKNHLRFINHRLGFTKTCSNKCSTHNFWNTIPNDKKLSLIKKSSTTFKNKYGVGTDGNSKLQEMKRKNSIKKWGTTHYLKSNKGQEIFKGHIKDKYGVDNIMQDPYMYKQINDKSKKMREYTLSTGEVIKSQGYNGKAFDFLLEYYDRSNILHEHQTTGFKYNDGKNVYRPDFEILNENQIYEVKSWWWFYRNFDKNIQKMKSVLESGFDYSFLIYKDDNSQYPIEIYPISDNLYVDECIQKLGLDNYNLLYIDNGVLVTDYNLCIKFIQNSNGYLDTDSKLLYRNESNKYCRMVVIYQDQLENNFNVVKSRVDSLLNQSFKIYARKCTIKIVDTKVARKFLDENHMQGSSTTLKYSIGLYLNDDLVSIMSFGGLRKSLGQSHIDGSYELLRFCNKLGCVVVGGASKLLKFFEKLYKPKSIISYADYSWSDGGVYENIGFSKVGVTDPGYWYMVNGKREHRFKYTKQKLITMGYDSSKTEKQIMMELGIPRFYDCGNLKYEKKYY